MSFSFIKQINNTKIDEEEKQELENSYKIDEIKFDYSKEHQSLRKSGLLNWNIESPKKINLKVQQQNFMLNIRESLEKKFGENMNEVDDLEGRSI